MIRIPALYDKSTGVDGRPITSVGGAWHNDFGGAVVQTDVGILPVINITGGSSVDGTFNLATAPDFIGITTTEEYDAMLNYAYSIPWEIPIVVNLPTVSYSYAGYYARAGLVELGYTFTDSGLDADLYAAEDYLNLGSELVVNGAFDTDISGWVGADAAAILEWDAGRIKITNGDVSAASATPEPFPIVSGKTYIFRWTSAQGTCPNKNTNLYFSSVLNGSDYFGPVTRTIDGDHSFFWTSDVTDPAAYLQIKNGATTLGIYMLQDNVSVREILDGPYTGN